MEIIIDQESGGVFFFLMFVFIESPVFKLRASLVICVPLALLSLPDYCGGFLERGGIISFFAVFKYMLTI